MWVVAFSPWTSYTVARRSVRVVEQFWYSFPLKGPSGAFWFFGRPSEERTREERRMSVYIARLKWWMNEWMNECGTLLEWYWKWRTELHRGNLVPLPFCPLRINPTWAGVGLSQGFRGDRTRSNRLSHGTLFMLVPLWNPLKSQWKVLTIPSCYDFTNNTSVIRSYV
jgi:hypothetical protein